MPAYQVLEPGQVYHTALGIDPAAGGSLTFYAPTTTTPVSTWSNPTLVTLNTNPVVLDSAGRAAVEVWMSDSVDVVLKDSDGATVWSRRIQPQVQTGGTIPTLQDGEFLTNDGTNLSWQPIIQVPDTTGSEGYQLVVTGGLPTWVAIASVVEPDVVVSESPPSFRAGISSDPTKFLMQFGTGSAPASGTRTTSATITFPVAYSKIFHVDMTANISVTGVVTGSTQAITGYVQGTAATSVTATFNSTDDGGESGYQHNVPVPFTWVAYGTVEVP